VSGSDCCKRCGHRRDDHHYQPGGGCCAEVDRFERCSCPRFQPDLENDPRQGDRRGGEPAARGTRRENAARFAQRGVRVQAGDGGFYVIVATGGDRAAADRVAQVVYDAMGDPQ
jgi:hypothetical protein